MTDLLDRTASFADMSASTSEDWQIIMAHLKPHAVQGGKRVLDHLRLLEGDCGGFGVDRLEHSLQTATRAHRDGRDEAYVVMALLHDIGDTLGAYNHQDIAAAVLKPFVSEELHWIVQHHAIFQGYNFFHLVGLDRNERDKFRGHAHFQATADFIEKYDSPAFDPNYDTAPLSFFEPMVMRQFMATLNTIYKDAFA